jgi:hypothetical protein
MCLACIIYHQDWVQTYFSGDHVIRSVSHVLKLPDILEKLKDPDFIKVTYPWNDNEHVFTGVPPHCAVLQHLARISEKQSEMLSGFVDNVVAGLDKAGVSGERLTSERIRDILNEFKDDLQRSLRVRNLATDMADISVNDNNNNDETGGLEPVEEQVRYRVHFHSGGFSMVPVDWRFPRCGVLDLWRQWWIGDNVRGIPPLRKLTCKDVKFLDRLPLSETEIHGRRGKFSGNRRLARKILNDINFLMNHLKALVVEKNAMPRIINEGSVDRMFSFVEASISGKDRDVQKCWSTVYKELRQRLHVEKRLAQNSNMAGENEIVGDAYMIGDDISDNESGN